MQMKKDNLHYLLQIVKNIFSLGVLFLKTRDFGILNRLPLFLLPKHNYLILQDFFTSIDLCISSISDYQKNVLEVQELGRERFWLKKLEAEDGLKKVDVTKLENLKKNFEKLNFQLECDIGSDFKKLDDLKSDLRSIKASFFFNGDLLFCSTDTYKSGIFKFIETDEAFSLVQASIIKKNRAFIDKCDALVEDLIKVEDSTSLLDLHKKKVYQGQNDPHQSLLKKVEAVSGLLTTYKKKIYNKQNGFHQILLDLFNDVLKKQNLTDTKILKFKKFEKSQKKNLRKRIQQQLKILNDLEKELLGLVESCFLKDVSVVFDRAKEEEIEIKLAQFDAKFKEVDLEINFYVEIYYNVVIMQINEIDGSVK